MVFWSGGEEGAGREEMMAIIFEGGEMAGKFFMEDKSGGVLEVEWLRRGRVEGGIGGREGWNGVGELEIF